MAPAMSRFTEKPMARAAEHLASARYAEAAGAFRAVLRIDPNEFQAHFGLADALVARGQRAEAVEGLVTAAESCSGQDDHAAALTLYGKALSIEPGRLELHLDVAMAEAALGRMESAQSRLENLAEVYMQAGRTDEAAEVYRCLAGWEDDGGEEAEAAPVQAAPVAQQRVTHVPTAAPARSVPSDAVPMMMMGTSETVVISTILVTPDGQLMQLPIERPQGQQPWPLKTGDTIPPIPAELIEAAHSAPIDLAVGEELQDADRTVVAFPPPPPTLPEVYESAAHTVNRKELEAAVVAAMDNLAQLEEEDMTLIMQRLPPQPKGQATQQRTRSGETRLPEFLVRSKTPMPARAPVSKPEPEPEPEPEPVAEDLAAEGKLRIKAAPRPPAPKAAPPAPATAASRPAAGKPAAPASRASGTAKPGAPATARPTATASAAKPAAAAGKPSTPVSRAGVAGKPAAPGSAAKPSVAAKPTAPAARAGVASKPAATPSRPGASQPAAAPSRAGVAGKPAASAAASSKARPTADAARPKASPTRPLPAEESAPKATRPNNPLAERLRRRAGLNKPEAAPGRPAERRSTEPITVRPPNPNKK
jgi:hypothetical protein